MEQIGWFVVGDGNFGPYLFGNQKSEPVGPVFIETEFDHQYWKNRGYDIIPVYVNGNDKEDYSFIEENNDYAS
jgi:hypothetical protein